MQFEAFAKGFMMLCGGPAIHLFSATELERLVCGNPILDFAALQANARYDGGYHAEHKVTRVTLHVSPDADWIKFGQPVVRQDNICSFEHVCHAVCPSVPQARSGQSLLLPCGSIDASQHRHSYPNKSSLPTAYCKRRTGSPYAAYLLRCRR